MRKITVKEVEYLAFRLAQELLSFKEPIPAFSTRFPNILESCLITPFQTFGGRSVYPSFSDKATALFYLMVKNHPFQNGNKRIAMTALFVFLHMNKKWLKADTQELYNFTMWIAQSPLAFKNESLRAIKKFIEGHLVNLGDKATS